MSPDLGLLLQRLRQEQGRHKLTGMWRLQADHTDVFLCNEDNCQLVA